MDFPVGNEKYTQYEDTTIYHHDSCLYGTLNQLPAICEMTFFDNLHSIPFTTPDLLELLNFLHASKV